MGNINHQNYGEKRFLSKPRKTLMVKMIPLSFFLTVDAFANISGPTTQNFNPSPAGTDYSTVESPKVINEGNIGLGLFLNQANNTLPYFGDDHINSGTRDTLTGAHFGVAYGLMEKLELHFGVPFVVDQKIHSDEVDRGEFTESGYTELKIGAKYQIINTSFWGLALSGSSNFNKTENDPSLGSGTSNTYNTEIISSISLGKLSLAGNIGYRLTSTPSEQTFENSPLEKASNKIIASTAISYDLSSLQSKIIFEVFGAFPNKGKDTDYNRDANSSEWVMGYKHFLDNDLSVSIGGGSEIAHGEYTPDLRIFAGINWKTSTRSTAKPQNIIVEEPVVNERNIVISDILFKWDSATLIESNASEVLETVVNEIERKEFSSLIISGHTCSLGKEAYNNDLSYRRARSIKKYLVNKYKIDPSIVEIRGLGEQQPIVPNDSDENRQLNRRVEFTFVKPNKNII